MRNNLTTIFENHSCLDKETLLAYAAGRLSAEAHHRAEKHLLDCDLCSAALEGLQENPDPDSFGRDVDMLNRRIDKFSGSPLSKPAHRSPNYRIAAVVALLVLSLGGVYYFLSERTGRHVLTENLPVRDSVNPGVENDKSAKPEALPPPQDLHESISSGDKIPMKPLPDHAEEKYNAEKVFPSLEKKPSISSKTNQEVVVQTGAGSATKDEVVIPPAPVSSNEEISDRLSKEQATTTDAAHTNAVMREKSPAFIADEADRALALYEAKKYREALPIFEQQASQKKNHRVDEMKWYLANCYLALQQTQKARILLTGLSKNNGPYQVRSDSLLKSMH